ncbi:MAG: 3-oxoacyl-ACP synthase III [Deltaproteobacteria bacterium]|jgi:3-oxoacyl-[acyl-carrier-protein] synthase-3|nr:3-oxoacyl-ACP synthase III [Deltaproteobacteria bacterium]
MRPGPTFEKVAILATARDPGPDRLATRDLERILAPLLSRLRLPAGLIGDMTGIDSRRLYPRGSETLLGGVLASEKLFGESGYPREEVDLLYSASVGKDFLEPSTASAIHERLGLGEDVASLDLGSACLGFMEGMFLGALQIEHGISRRTLVVAGENARPVLENTVEALLGDGDATRERFFENFATLTLGSGGASVLLGRTEEDPLAPRIRRMVRKADPASNRLCRGSHEGMVTDSGELLAKGVALAKKTFDLGRELHGWTPELFDLVVCHQVSEINTRKFALALGLPWEKIAKTYPDHGNMGPVAVPFTLDLARERGLLKKGRTVLLAGIGSGLASAMMEVVVP